MLKRMEQAAWEGGLQIEGSQSGQRTSAAIGISLGDASNIPFHRKGSTISFALCSGDFKISCWEPEHNRIETLME